ncbi:single-stranded DNA-binding protein [Streptomyces sp. SID8111]|nr:single-stranded DNA-binding protein [Streptomyces sp. SID8111]NEC30287.1 single-stranded DNA-binding protein [Streptomyces sp. SID8111]
MNETMVCAVGNVATSPVYRELASGPSVRFRLAVTARYWDREKGMWTDGHTNFFTVWANRQLATNAAASLSLGEPVVVQGRLKVRTEQRDGQQGRVSADIDAVTIGHDLARGTSAFRRSGRPEQPAAAAVPERPEPNWETPPDAAARPTAFAGNPGDPAPVSAPVPGAGPGVPPAAAPTTAPVPEPAAAPENPVAVPVPAPVPVAEAGPVTGQLSEAATVMT